MARRTAETGCCVLLTHVPPAGELAHRAGEVLWADQEPHGVEQNVALLKDPVLVTSLFLKQPERSDAFGVV
jgi:hypothetical protein